MKRSIIIGGVVVICAVALAGFLFLSAKTGVDGKPVNYWISQMEMSDGAGGTVGASALDRMSPKETVPYLIQTIARTNGKESGWQSFYRRHFNQIPGIIRKHLSSPFVVDPNGMENIRYMAADYLAKLGGKNDPYALAATSELIQLLEAPDSKIRFAACIALEGFGTNAEAAVPVLIRIVQTSPDKITDPEMHLLEHPGTNKEAAVSALKLRLNGGSAFQRIKCARTLWVIDHSQADLVRPAAVEIAKTKDAGDRIEAATLLWRMDKDGAEVTPILIGLLKEDNHPFGYRTILLLKSMGPKASDAIPALGDWLDRNRAKAPAFVITAAIDAIDAMSSGNPTNVVKQQ